MGSNIDPEHHLMAAANALRSQFPGIVFSAVYRSAAVGMGEEAADFLNSCALLDTDQSIDGLVAWLKGLEDAHGRDRSQGSWRPRTLDLDLICFDGVWLEDVMAYPHCYLPAAELMALPAPIPVSQQRIVRIGVTL